MTEKFKLVPVEPTPEMLKAGAKEVDWYDHNASDCYRAMLAAAPDAPAAEPVAFEMDWPDYLAEGMGCGLEDRNITNRYEAMRYGWEEAIERCAESLPEELYTHAPDASAIIAAKDAKIAELISENIEQQKYILSMERIISEQITRKEAQK